MALSCTHSVAWLCSCDAHAKRLLGLQGCTQVANNAKTAGNVNAELHGSVATHKAGNTLQKILSGDLDAQLRFHNDFADWLWHVDA